MQHHQCTARPSATIPAIPLLGRSQRTLLTSSSMQSSIQVCTVPPHTQQNVLHVTPVCPPRRGPHKPMAIPQALRLHCANHLLRCCFKTVAFLKAVQQRTPAAARLRQWQTSSCRPAPSWRPAPPPVWQRPLARAPVRCRRLRPPHPWPRSAVRALALRHQSPPPPTYP